MNNNNNNKNMHHSVNEFSLFVGDLPHDCSDDKLQRLFQSKFKSVKRVQIIRNEDGSSRGFGFIRFEDRADFQAALSQEMKIGSTTLRLDTAHRHGKSNRSRYNSFNSTGSNNSNHHHHFNHNNLHHHHHHHNQQQHHHQQHHQHNQPQTHHHHHQQSSQQNMQNINNKTLMPDHAANSGTQQTSSNHQTLGGPTRHNNNSHQQPGAAVSSNGPGQHLSIHQHQQHPHNNSNSMNQTLFNSQTKGNQRQQTPDRKSPKSSVTLGGDEASNPQQPTQSMPKQPQQLSMPQQTQAHHNSSQANSSNSGNIGAPTPGSNLTVATTSTATTTTISSSNLGHHSSVAIQNSHQNLSQNPQALGPDLRGYAQAAMIDTSHLLGATEQPSIVPPTSVYGHMYPYGPPPHFGYMPPPPQPNPVIPISAVPPAPPNQASPSTGVGQQHSMSASSGSRYSGAHHHHHQPPQQPHPSTADSNAMSTMHGGVQAPHQGPPFYYYYPTPPMYFDQSGGATAAAPPNLYHPQTFHPQFFAVPNPAFMPNAHTYNQHQPQPPTASQSDATVVNPQQPHQPQVNLRTRDIDTIE